MRQTALHELITHYRISPATAQSSEHKRKNRNPSKRSAQAPGIALASERRNPAQETKVEPRGYREHPRRGQSQVGGHKRKSPSYQADAEAQTQMQCRRQSQTLSLGQGALGKSPCRRQ